MAIHKFESVAAYGRHVKTLLGHSRARDWGKSGTGEALAESVEYAINGNTKLVTEAEKLMDKLQTSIEVKSRQWGGAVAGAFPCVPDYLIGHPESMRKLDDCVSDSVPLRVFCCTSSSGAMDWQQLQRRGVAVLAATMALCQSRPVELWTFTPFRGNGQHGECNIMVRVNSSPLCLSEACVALGSIGFDRNLGMTIGYVEDAFDGGWARILKNAGFDDESRTIEACREMLGASENDLIIPPAHASFQQIYSDPIGWVQKILNQYAASVY